MLAEMRASSALVGVRSLQIHVQLRANCSQLSQRSASALPAAQPRFCGARQALVRAPRGPGRIRGHHWRAPKVARGGADRFFPAPSPPRSRSSAGESLLCTRDQSSEILVARDHLSCDSKMLRVTQDFEASRGMYVRIAFRSISCVALRSLSSRFLIFSDPASLSQLNSAGAAFPLVSRQFPLEDK